MGGEEELSSSPSRRSTAEMRPKRQAGPSPGGSTVIGPLLPACGLNEGERQSEGELAGRV